MQKFTTEGGMRLDVFLAQEGIVSRMKARDLVKKGCVLVNGRIARKSAVFLHMGDVIEVSASLAPVTETRLSPSDMVLPILYEDDACLVLLKPAGIAVHPGAGMPKDAETILHGIVRLFRERGLPFSSSSVLVHRIDKDTTGCLLVAKTPQAHKTLQQQFADRTIGKTYLALVAGIPDPPAAVIDATIGRSTFDRTKMTVIGAGKSREARTTYRTLAGVGAADAAIALLACDLHTGRTHQIRVHLKSIGHPLLGDHTYGSRESEALSAKLGITSLCLHAWKLAFVSPVDAHARTVEAPLPPAFRSVLQSVGLSDLFR